MKTGNEHTMEYRIYFFFYKLVVDSPVQKCSLRVEHSPGLVIVLSFVRTAAVSFNRNYHIKFFSLQNTSVSPGFFSDIKIFKLSLSVTGKIFLSTEGLQ